jgi:hypothetical protein
MGKKEKEEKKRGEREKKKREKGEKVGRNNRVRGVVKCCL